ncbi:neutrophil gelatinase-associated lipocalin-like isoform X2 [Cavia porcellus]|uniref:neutrophil gelatinase-associated lipocalin-like isoform X2 n=1 Tax=Cavia porcellus TaxID=10141 RepID=UPI002FE2C112
MAWALLCLGLTLLGALNIEALDSLPTTTSSSPLSNSLLLPDFQYEQAFPVTRPLQFKGNWHPIVWALHTIWNENQSKEALHTTTHKPNDDHSYNVTSDWLSDWECPHKSNIMFPSDHPGLFPMENAARNDGLQNFTVKVLETDHKQFVMVFFKMTLPNMVYLEHTLYGRTMELSPVVKEHFLKVTRSLGLPDDHIIFADPEVECTD